MLIEGERVVTVQICNSPDSWGVWFPNDPKQPSWQQYLDEVALAGFQWTELGPFGYLPTDTETLRSELALRALKLVGGTISLPLEEPGVDEEIESQLATICTLVRSLDAEFLVLFGDFYQEFGTSNLRKPRRLDDKSWSRLVERTNSAGRYVRDRFGLQLAFHPHAGTHVEYEDEIETLLSETDPSVVGLCLDTGHHAYCGGDVVAFMAKHHARINYLHLKNVSEAAVAHANDEGMNFVTATGEGACTCLDDGIIDFAAVKRVIDEKKISVPFVVEQDMYPTSSDRPLGIARRNRAVLRALNFG